MPTLIEQIEALEVDEAVKASLKKEAETFKSEINSASQATREELTNKLKTAEKSVENLTSLNDGLKTQLKNKGDDKQQNARILELEAELKTANETSEGYKTNYETLQSDLHTKKAQDVAREQLKLHHANEHEFIVEDLATGLVQGSDDKTKWFFVDDAGAYIPVETRASSLMETKYKALTVAKGANTGGTGENGNVSSSNGGMPKTKEEYLKLDETKRNEFAKNNFAEVKQLLTS